MDCKAQKIFVDGLVGYFVFCELSWSIPKSFTLLHMLLYTKKKYESAQDCHLHLSKFFYPTYFKYPYNTTPSPNPFTNKMPQAQLIPWSSLWQRL